MRAWRCRSAEERWSAARAGAMADAYSDRSSGDTGDQAGMPPPSDTGASEVHCFMHYGGRLDQPFEAHVLRANFCRSADAQPQEQIGCGWKLSQHLS